MDSGNWCCPNENQGTPSYIGAWGATLLGWLTPTIADSNVLLSAFDLKPLESAEATAVLIPLSPSTYYVVEARAKSGRDSMLPPSGILIYFVNELLDTGGGILRLENPATNILFAPQERTGALNVAVFKPSDQFSDAAHRVYVAFVGGTDIVTTLFSTQPLTASFMTTNLRTSVSALSGMFSDQVSLGGTLLAQNGLPLGAQNVEVDIYDPISSQWKRIASGSTDQLGAVSLQLSLSSDVGDYLARLFYPGGKSGSVWYTSSFLQFSLRIVRATMTLNVSPPTIVFDKASVGISVIGLHGEPLAGAVVTVYVNNVQAGVVRTDETGKASLILQFAPTELGSHIITAKASAANYEVAQNSGNTLVIPFWLIAIIVIATIGSVAAIVWTSGRRRRAQ
jgi:hypothetical protein